SSNMLYPWEDRAHRRLMYACRNCDYREHADNYRVYEHVVQQAPTESNMARMDLSSDPSLPRTTSACPLCGSTEAVYFQSSSRRADTKMTLYYVCVNKDCRYLWTG
ncbi:hypothetical protein SYNPS1DRAFT_19400, partial [Syncephalis pseudoplumigaleata]